MKMNKHLFALALVATTLTCPSLRAAEKPNVVLFLVDDQSWVGTSAQMRPDDPKTKSDFLETDAPEAMAAAGMRFTDAYSTAPVCCPSQTALESGQTTARTRVTFNARNNSTGPGRSIAQTLAPAGYICGRYGETGLDHISADELGNAEHRVWRGNTAGDHDDVPVGDHTSANNEPLSPDNPKRTPEITRCGIEFLKRRAQDEQPFFLYLSYFAVHVALQATSETIAKYEAKKPGVKHDDIVYAAMTEELDDALRQVRAKLRELGLDRNTVLIYTSDNGGQLLKQGHTTSGRECDTLNLPLSGWKATLYEGGVRVPLLASWPGVIPAGRTSEAIIRSEDFYPTILDLAGVPKPAQQTIDGSSFAAVLRDPSLKRDMPAFFPTQFGVAVRSGNWKLILNYKDKSHELYNLREDLGETNDLAAQHPERVRGMFKLLKDHFIDTGCKMRSDIWDVIKASRQMP